MKAVNKRIQTPYNCRVCNAVFYPFRASKGWYCSKKCSGRANTVNKVRACLGCNKTFENKKHYTKYCSNPCYQEAKRNRTLYERIMDQLEITGSCWVWTGGRNERGYGRIYHNGTFLLTHRAFYQLMTGEDLTDKVVRHFVCDNPPCCNPAHLRSGTKADNSQDAVNHKRHAHGETTYAKLTEAQALAIISDPRQHAIIARDYNVARRTVGHIKTGTTWKHLPRS